MTNPRTIGVVTDGSRAPELSVLETVLYYEDQGAAERFYVDVLGMRLISKQPVRSLFFRAGSSVFLLFDASATQKSGELPPHGATGSGHVCFVVEPASYQGWKSHLKAHGVEILKEVTWPARRGTEAPHSFYFRDPHDNLLEIADADLWPD